MRKSVLIIGVIAVFICTSGVHAVTLYAPNNARDLTNHYYIFTGKAPNEENILESLKYSHTNSYTGTNYYYGITEFGTALRIVSWLHITNTAIRDTLIELHDVYPDRNGIIYAILNCDIKTGTDIISNILCDTTVSLYRRLMYAKALSSIGILLGYPLLEEGLSSSNPADRFASEMFLVNISLYEGSITRGGYKVDTAHLLKIARDNSNIYSIAKSKGLSFSRYRYLDKAQENLWAHYALQTITNSCASMTNRLYTAITAVNKGYYFGYELIEPGLISQDPAVKTAAEQLLREYIKLDGLPAMSRVSHSRHMPLETTPIDCLHLLDVAKSNSCLTITREELDMFRYRVTHRREFK